MRHYKKARKWLDKNKIDYIFHNYRVDGITKTLLNTWVKELEWEILLNTRGTTWRKLPDSKKEGLTKNKALSLMIENPAMIKRPVLAAKNKLYVGFDEDVYKSVFK